MEASAAKLVMEITLPAEIGCAYLEITELTSFVGLGDLQICNHNLQ